VFPKKKRSRENCELFSRTKKQKGGLEIGSPRQVFGESERIKKEGKGSARNSRLVTPKTRVKTYKTGKVKKGKKGGFKKKGGGKIVSCPAQGEDQAKRGAVSVPGKLIR